MPNCSSCGEMLVERVNRSTGEYFWGCSGFPKCKKTQPYLEPGSSIYSSAETMRTRRALGTGDFFLSKDELDEAWAEAMTHDCGDK